MNHQLDSHSVAEYLAANTHFFEEHAELLARIKLTSPLAGRTVSLQERQMEVLREKIKALELRMTELVRIAQDNDVITHKFQSWAKSLLLARNDVDLPHVLTSGLQSIFSVPHATLRIWGVAEEFAHTWFAAPVSSDAHLFANGLTTPFCGSNKDFEAVSWLEDAPAIQSLAMLPLRPASSSEPASDAADAPAAFGLLILGSHDPARFSEDMATDFLGKIGETASAALSCLIG
ncbi:MAG: DUF484 family protein [Burkholderiaceae bacterium]|nr:DUF484 family protein [Burkholderiaceae bacterium]